MSASARSMSTTFNVIEDVRELIGNTPLLKLNHFYKKPGVSIYAKLELFNPGGSVKDRSAIAMIAGAKSRGLLTKDSVIVEATAGNMGLGLALATLNEGYKLILVVPEKFSIEKQQLMKALGAQLVITPLAQGMKGAMKRAEELVSEIPHAMSLKQFENRDNVEAHYRGTGPEIFSALGGSITHFVAGAGSGGTFSGVTKYLKQQSKKIQGIVAEPIGSTMGGGEEGDYEIEGIGNSFVPSTMDMTLVDRFIQVSDESAFEVVKRLALTEGILAGSSSGAALAAAVELADSLEQGTIVVILPDSGERYFSKSLWV
jgi:cysteine synthase A